MSQWDWGGMMGLLIIISSHPAPETLLLQINFLSVGRECELQIEGRLILTNENRGYLA